MSTDMLTARLRLSQFIRDKVARMVESSGIPFVATPNAPSTYRELRAAYGKSRLLGVALPVSNEFSGLTIYDRPDTNWACRYWHDWTHCIFGADFSLGSELHVGRVQSDEVSDHFGKGSLEHLLMLADTVGQSLYESAHGKFPDNQRQFCYDWVLANRSGQ